MKSKCNYFPFPIFIYCLIVNKLSVTYFPIIKPCCSTVVLNLLSIRFLIIFPNIFIKGLVTHIPLYLEYCILLPFLMYEIIYPLFIFYVIFPSHYIKFIALVINDIIFPSSYFKNSKIMPLGPGASPFLSFSIVLSFHLPIKFRENFHSYSPLQEILLYDFAITESSIW